jgi:alpha-aminoadipic semialdehyde synthase
MVPPIIAADWSGAFESLALPPSLKRAVIVHKGVLTPSYRYLEKHLDAGRN